MMGAGLSTRKLTKINKWLKFVHDRFLPPRCVLCGQQGDDGRDICQPCAAELPYVGSGCQRCAIPMDFSAQGECGVCQKTPPNFDEAKATFLYQEPIDYLVCSLKFDQKLYCARLLGGLMADRLGREVAPEDRPDLIVPVPLHPARLRQRGFNQALELARPVSKALDIPLMLDLCERRINTEPQTSMDGEARRSNLLTAFEVKRPVRGRHVGIVDDVMTTGSTVDVLAGVLKEAGAKRVSVWVCARSER